MLLLKSFFRHKKTIIYLQVLCIITIILLLLNGINSFINNELDHLKHENSSLIMFSLNNHNQLLEKETEITSYNRILPLTQGRDNNIIYTPKYIELEDGSIAYESIDYSKIEWKRLIYDEENYPYILTFPASYCNVTLNDNEVILALEEDLDYRLEYKDNYLDNNIYFQYQNQELKLKIKNIIEPKTFKYICISNNIYNNLIVNEEKYIYLINTKNYLDIEKLEDKWQDLEDNDFYSINTNIKYDTIETNDKETSLSNLSNMLRIANFISFIIFTIIAIFVIKDLISDEEKNINLLKQLGYNKTQIMKSTLINMLVLDIIILLISQIVSLILSIILNTLLDLNIQVFSIKLLFSIIVFIILFEFIFLIKPVNNKFRKE